MRKVSSKLKIKTPNDVFDVVLVSLMLIWDRFHILFWCFQSRLWTSKSKPRINPTNHFHLNKTMIFQLEAGFFRSWKMWKKACFFIPECLLILEDWLFTYLTLSIRRALSYRVQSIDLLRKSMDWFLYDNGLRLERVNNDNFDFHLTKHVSKTSWARESRNFIKKKTKTKKSKASKQAKK